jgi:hypothetical protein
MTSLFETREHELMRRLQRPRGWGSKLLPRFKDANGKKYQLHATKGWRCIGKAKGSKNA